ncbi:MAG TPA: ROK family transcriptional regulator [Balneolales bacterium]|nr:ROK family transcriptional regulator [Balneolales bacterium]
MLTGTNLTYTKAYNYRIVFETIRLFGPLSRADIARRSNLTAQTVSNIVKRLIDTNLIREGSKRQDGRGAPSIILEINPEGAYSIGIDFNRDHLTGILLDLTGNVKQHIYYELETPVPGDTIDLMAASIKELIKQQDLEEKQIGGIGISFPGPIDFSRNKSVATMVNPKAFPNWVNVPVLEMLSRHMDVPIFLENNASAAAVGERWYGDGRHVSSFLYIFFGAGLGGGLVLNGQLYDGITGNAGEIGYLPYSGPVSMLSNSDRPHIGEHFNISRLYKWLDKKGVRALRPADLLNLYEKKNPVFMEWLEQAINILAPAFLSIEYIVDPEIIFLGGTLPEPIILDLCNGLKSRLPNLRIDGKETVPDLRLATAGSDASALGAATLPMFDLFAPQHEVLVKQNGSFSD